MFHPHTISAAHVSSSSHIHCRVTACCIPASPHPFQNLHQHHASAPVAASPHPPSVTAPASRSNGRIPFAQIIASKMIKKGQKQPQMAKSSKQWQKSPEAAKNGQKTVKIKMAGKKTVKQHPEPASSCTALYRPSSEASFDLVKKNSCISPHHPASTKGFGHRHCNST